MYMVYFKLFFLKLEGLHPLYFLINLLRWHKSGILDFYHYQNF